MLKPEYWGGRCDLKYQLCFKVVQQQGIHSLRGFKKTDATIQFHYPCTELLGLLATIKIKCKEVAHKECLHVKVPHSFTSFPKEKDYHHTALGAKQPEPHLY